MHFFIRDDLYEAGRSAEDNEPIYGQVFYVVAQDENGARWSHNAAFRDTLVSFNHEHGSDIVERRTEAASDAAAKVLARIVAAGGVIDLAHWFETDPEYGSAAYQEIDAVGGHRYSELRAAEDRGEIAIGAADRMMVP